MGNSKPRGGIVGFAVSAGLDRSLGQPGRAGAVHWRFLRNGGRVLTVVVILAVLCGGAGFAQGRASDSVVLPFEATEYGLLLRAQIEGPKTPGRTVLLFVDTGATSTHLDAGFLKLPRTSRSLRTHGIDGGADLRVLERVTLTLADAGGTGRAFDIQTLDVDLAARRKWCKCDLAGVLGLDVLRRFDGFSFDFRDQTLTLVKGKKKN